MYQKIFTSPRRTKDEHYIMHILCIYVKEVDGLCVYMVYHLHQQQISMQHYYKLDGSTRCMDVLHIEHFRKENYNFLFLL